MEDSPSLKSRCWILHSNKVNLPLHLKLRHFIPRSGHLSDHPPTMTRPRVICLDHRCPIIHSRSTSMPSSPWIGEMPSGMAMTSSCKLTRDGCRLGRSTSATPARSPSCAYVIRVIRTPTAPGTCVSGWAARMPLNLRASNYGIPTHLMNMSRLTFPSKWMECTNSSSRPTDLPGLITWCALIGSSSSQPRTIHLTNGSRRQNPCPGILKNSAATPGSLPTGTTTHHIGL
mmetsp:Transcript_46509/g.98653  ORF Transcript_46509/g.98653 Transcript_46509/m.98653 type:complete len:230 (-) Transcript_46509:1222-1911(-)